MKNFGEQLKNKRKESGISQSDLAEKVGVHSQTVSKWERGIMFPDVGQYGDIANALGIPLEKLLDQPLGAKYYKGEFSVQLLSETITVLRRKKAISQSDLADAVGYSPDAVSRWERGITSPDIDSIIIMSRVFGLPLSTLYYGVPSQKQSQKKERDRKFERKLKILLGAIASAAVVALGVTLAVLIPGKIERGDFEKPGRYSEVVVDGEIMRVLTGTRYTPKSKEIKGYDFIGWKDKSGEFVTIPVTIEKEFMTLDPVYELHEYGIEYELDGGEFPCDPPTSFNVTSGEITVPVPTRPGYKFLGWEKRDGLVYREVTAISCRAKDVVLRARWKSTQDDLCEITVDGVGHYLPKGSQYMPEHEEKEGYDFIGWKDKSGNIVSVPITVDKNLEIAAEYQLHEYTITYQLNGGKFLIEPPRTYTLKGRGLIVPVQEGYNFKGWYDNSEFSGSEIGYIRGMTGDIVLYAKWEEVETGISEDGFGYAIEDNRAVITEYLGDRGKDVWLNIPERIKGFPVTKIRCTFGSDVPDRYCEYADITMPLLEELGENAFAWVKCENEVVIPPTVERIGRNCFYGAYLNLKFSTAGEALNTVGEDAFANAKLTAPLVLPESVRRIEKRGLYGVCAVLNDGLETIESGAIVLEEGNEGIFIPSSVKYIGENGITCANKGKGKIYMQGDASSARSFEKNWNGGIEVEYSHKAAWITFIDGEGRYKKYGYYVILDSPDNGGFIGWETDNGVLITGKIYYGGYGATLTARYN